MPNSRIGVPTSASRSSWASRAPQPPTTPLSSRVITSSCSPARPSSAGIDRQRPDRVDHGHPDPLVGQPLADRDADAGQLAEGDDEHPRLARCAAARPARRPGRTGGQVGRHLVLGEAQHRGRVVDLQRPGQRLPQPGAVPGRGQVQAGHQLGDRHVPHAVVTGPVRTGDAGPVEHEGHAAAVQRDVHQQLVEGPVEEGGVDRDHRVQPAHRQPGRRGDGVLLGDADVEAAVGERRGEPVQAGRVEHGRGDRDHPLVGAAQPEQLLGEHVGPGLAGAAAQRRAGDARRSCRPRGSGPPRCPRPP